MKWFVSVMMMLVMLCVSSVSVKADLCADYAAFLDQVLLDVASTCEDLFEVEAEIVEQEEAVASALLNLQQKQAEYNRLRALFIVDEAELQLALDNVRAAQNFLDLMKSMLKDLQDERDRLNDRLAGLNDTRAFLLDYLNTHCVQTPNVGPTPDPNFP